MYAKIYRTLSLLTQETRYRPLIRLMVVLYALTLGLLLSLNIIDALTNIDLEAILNLQRSHLAIGIFATLLSIPGPASIGILWVLMLHHWRTHAFQPPGWKDLWLAALLFGNILLTPVYYVVVFELGRTLRKSNEGNPA